MKRKILFLTLIPLILTACGDTPSNKLEPTSNEDKDNIIPETIDMFIPDSEEF